MSDYLLYRDGLGPLVEALAVDGCEGDDHVRALFAVGLQGLGGGYSNDEAFHEVVIKQACFEVLTNLASVKAHMDDVDWNEALDTVIINLRRLRVEL